jgi:hypothetical protein
MSGAKGLSAILSSALVLVAAAGCRTTNEDHTISSLEKDNLPAAIDTIEQWNQLEPDVKAAILDSEYVRYKSLVVTPWKNSSELSDNVQQDLVKKMQSFMGSNGATEVADDSYSKVGPLNARVRFLLIGNSVIGSHIEYWQEGCEMPDESVNSFPSKEAAEGSGCELLGASWKSHGLFNHNGSPLEYSDFMEWSH